MSQTLLLQSSVYPFFMYTQNERSSVTVGQVVWIEIRIVIVIQIQIFQILKEALVNLNSIPYKLKKQIV